MNPSLCKERSMTAAGRRGIRAFAIEPGTVITAVAEWTIASSDAQRRAPLMVDRFSKFKVQQDRAAGRARCVDRGLKLSEGRYDALSGRLFTPEDDLEGLIRQAQN
jgi:hypothetical protein